MDTLRDTVEKAVKRVGGVKMEMDELSRRPWKGGEMPFAAPTTEVCQQLAIALDAMRHAERLMASLVSKAEAKGK
jgi:hypothetical protein